MSHGSTWVRAKPVRQVGIPFSPLVNYRVLSGPNIKGSQDPDSQRVQGHEKQLISKDWGQHSFWELEKRVVQMGLDEDIWKSKHAARTQIRGKKTTSKHKLDETLGTKTK